MATLDESPSDQQTIELLEQRAVAWFCTIHPDGKPHIVPVWFSWHDNMALVLSQPKAQKLKNIRHNASCTLALDDSENGHQPVVFDGTATLEEGPLSGDALDHYLVKYSEMLAEMDWTVEAMLQEYSQVIQVAPTRFLRLS